jgi:hypothetical protein
MRPNVILPPRFVLVFIGNRPLLRRIKDYASNINKLLKRLISSCFKLQTLIMPYSKFYHEVYMQGAENSAAKGKVGNYDSQLGGT